MGPGTGCMKAQLPSAPLTPRSILEGNVSNYGSRAAKFSDWAEKSSNAETAAFARGVLLRELRKRLQAGLFGSITTIRILDIGCGSGRDVREFNLEPDVECDGLEPCAQFSPTIEQNLNNGGRVFLMSIEDLASSSIEDQGQMGCYHGIFAMASLFHLERDSIFHVLQKMVNVSLHHFGCVLSTLPDKNQNARGSDGRWHSGFALDTQTKLFTRLSTRCATDVLQFQALATERVSIYNGTWALVLAGASMEQRTVDSTKDAA